MYSLERKSSAAPEPQLIPIVPSQSLEWLWQLLKEERYPAVLDCGPIRASTFALLMARHVRLYGGDILRPLLESDPELWDRTRKEPVFRAAHLLEGLPPVPPESLSLILAWNVFDLIPPQAVPAVFGHLLGCLKPQGLIFLMLREPSRTAGVETRIWLEQLTALRTEPDATRTFPYPPVSNRQIENLAQGCSVKIFLTRNGRREIAVLRQR